MRYPEKLLTISVAAYNVQSYIEKLLMSLIVPEALEYLDIIIINDGSTDKTAAIGYRYAEKYPESFRVINKPNGGWGSTVNEGIRKAKGRYFKILDADDWFPTENMSAFLQFLKGASSDLILTPYYEADDQTEKIADIKGLRLKAVAGRVHKAFGHLPHGTPLDMHGVTARTEFLREANIAITEKCYYADLEFVIKVVNCCKSIEVFPFPTYVYRIARKGQSVSNEGFAQHYRDNLKILKKLLFYCETQLSCEDNREVFIRRMEEAVHGQYWAFLCAKPSPARKKELKEFDCWLKDNYRSYYKNCKWKKIRILRITGFCGYMQMARLHQWRQM